MSKTEWWLLFSAVMHCVGIILAAFAFGGQPAPVDLYLAGLGIAFAAYTCFSMVLLKWLNNSNTDIGESSTKKPAGISIWLAQTVLMIAILSRLIMLVGPHRFNSDVARYVWDGYLLTVGINPYQFAPNDPALDEIRDPDRFADLNPEFNDLKTVYGPVAMLGFAVANVLPGQPSENIRILMVLADLLAIFLLTRVLAINQKSQLLVGLYALNPLLIDSFAQRGQMDGMLMPVFAGCLLALANRNYHAFGISAGLAVLIKLNALLLIPLALQHAFRQGKGPFLKTSCAIAVVTVLGVIPFLAAGIDGFSGLQEYANRWQANASVFAVIKFFVDDSLARWFAASVYLVTFLFVMRIRFLPAENSFSFMALLAFGGLLLLSPTVFPWYLTWLLPFVPLCQSGERDTPFFMAVSCWTMMSLFWYLNFIDNGQNPAFWLQTRVAIEFGSQFLSEPWRVIEYGSVCFFLVVYLLRTRRVESGKHTIVRRQD